MGNITDYIDPNLLVLAVALYIAGEMIKSSKVIKNKYLPILLGVVGIIVSGVWVCSTYDINTYKDVFGAIFTSVVQGAMTAGLAVYGNQVMKQLTKKDE